MPSKAPRRCPRCRTISVGPCKKCQNARRVEQTSSPYKTRTWRKIRDAFLRDNPTCVICGAPSQVPDHHPISRRELIRHGCTDPDAPRHLRALCLKCHRSATATTQVEHDNDPRTGW